MLSAKSLVIVVVEEFNNLNIFSVTVLAVFKIYYPDAPVKAI